jgi:glycosyltransferase involved in cell wall biosynthesis
MKLSIVIPCFNEINSIEKILKKIKLLNNFLDFEIIVVDDCSTDGSSLVLSEKCKDYYTILIKNEKNYGKGYSVRKGVENATGEYILIQDADLEYDPKDYQKILSPLLQNKADVVYGTRFSGSDERKIHFFWHTLANKLLTFFCNIKTNLNLSDMECGFKAFKTNIIKEVCKNLEEDRFGFEPEVTIKLARKKVSFYEVGINYYGRSYAEGKKISFKDALRALYVIIFK